MAYTVRGRRDQVILFICPEAGTGSRDLQRETVMSVVRSNSWGAVVELRDDQCERPAIS